MKTYIAAYLSAVLMTLLLTPLIVRLARWFNWLDVPNARKVHKSPTPRVGGLAIVIAVCSVIAVVMTLSNLVGSTFRTNEPRIWPMVLAGLMVFAIGLIDDISHVSPKLKLIVIVFAAGVVCSTGTQISALRFGPWRTIELGAFSWPLSMVWIVGVTVSLNFIDGLDGLAAGIAAVTAGVIAAVAASYGCFITATMALALLGSLTGFLCFNFHPAKIFLGDCGSLFIGFMLAASTVLCAAKSHSYLAVLVPALPLGIPILDTVATMIRRGILQRRPLFAAERGHVHHRLLDLGLRQRDAVLILYASTILTAGVGVAMFLTNSTHTLRFAALLLLPLAIFKAIGLLHFRSIISALRRNNLIGQSTKSGNHLLAEMQSKMRASKTFDEWWLQVCEAATAMELTRVSLALQNRDGSERALSWSKPNSAIAPDETVNSAIPVRHRRAGPPLRCEMEAASLSLELASHRIMLFTRLLDEFSPAALPSPLRTVREGCHGPHAPLRPISRGILSSIPANNGFSQKKLKSRRARRNGGAIIGGPSRPRKIAVVHDFLYVYAGAERVLEQILQVYPEADVFALFDFVPDDQRGFLGDKKVTTTFLQKMPGARKRHRAYLPLMPLAIEQLDVSTYDMVISSSYLAAKGVLTRADQLHVCYCHTPVRFAWDLQRQYLSEAGLVNGIKSWLARVILHYIRNWDTHSTNSVNVFLTNSNYVGRRINKIYRRRALTVYPPVDVEKYELRPEKEGFYLTVSRLVSYKRIDLIIEAFNELPNRRLIVIGDGPEMEYMRAIAKPNITLLGYQPFEQVKEYMQRARAFIFAAEEDFGIVPVEAQACGTPVIAYGRGGVTESIVDGRTGVFFQQQTVECLLEAIKDFEASDVAFDPNTIRANAEQFSAAKFREKFHKITEDAWMAFSESHSVPANEVQELPIAGLGLESRYVDLQPASTSSVIPQGI